MKKAISLDIASQNKDIKLNFIELLAGLAAKNGNNFKNYKASQLDAIAEKLNSGQTIEELTAGLKYYSYYHEAYCAVLGGFVGDFDIEVLNEDGNGNLGKMLRN